jgi:hypothetical protein
VNRGKRQQAAQAHYCEEATALPREGVLSNRETWERLGFRFGSEYGPWVEVRFPEGWRLAPDRSGNPLLNSVLDDSGRVRATVLYKVGDFGEVDCSAAGPYLRFAPCADVKDGWLRLGVWDRLAEAMIVVFRGFPVAELASPPEATAEREKESLEKAVAWLTDHYPNYADPAAYW